MITVTPLRLVCLFLALLCCHSLQAQPSAAYTNNGTGREFWIAIPPNEYDGAYPSLDLEIYVTSAFDTRVTIEHPGSGFRTTKNLRAGQTVTFSTMDQTASWAWEVREDEKASSQGIRLTADRPVSVSVLNSKQVTADGYTALPTEAWGTEYRHLAFYDFGEVQEWGAGFVIVAKENDTKVQFRLQGVDNGNPEGRTRQGKRLGTNVNVTLQRGQTYMIRGNGKTMNEFDFSGTRIVSNKPVGVISFHQRTMIPGFPSPNNGRDHIVEMVTPVHGWGTEHVSLELNRMQNRGDFFRIVAAEDNTKFQCRYTDLVTKETYSWEGVLHQAGDFMEKENTWPPSTSIRGTAVWTSDKPTLVMQYAYSAEWDGGSTWDPSMMRIVPTAQYTKAAMIQTPSNVAFVNNHINFIAIGDTNDPKHSDLRTITLDGKPIYMSDTTFLSNRIQNTQYYYARLRVPAGVHTLTGATPFTANVYGQSAFSGYSWTAAELYNKLTGIDTLAPVMSVSGLCDQYTVVVSEKQGSADNLDDSVQTDSGISRIELDYALSRNMEIIYQTDGSPAIHIEPRREEFTVHLKPIDLLQPGFGVIYAVDRAGNVIVDSVRYTPAIAAIEPKALSFGTVRVNRTATTTATVSNPLNVPITIENLFLKNGTTFSLTPPAFPLTLASHASIQVEVEYHPEMPAADRDTIMAAMTCGEIMLGEVQGQAGIPSLQVFGWDFGVVDVGETRCRPITFTNTGPFPLTLSTIATTSEGFSLEGPDPALPLTLAPGEAVNLKSLCFTPEGEEAYAGSLIIEWISDGEAELDTIEVFGTGNVVTGIVSEDKGIFQLVSVPNPVTDRLQLRYTLPVGGAVRAELFSASGSLVGVLHEGWQEAGPRVLDVPVDVAAGVYLCRLVTPSGTATCKITITD